MLASARELRQDRPMDQPSVAKAIRDPAWLAHRYDPVQDAFHFRHVDRARHREVAFLTDEYLGNAEQPLVVGRADALRQAPSAAPLHFIFHSAFCASTMLVRALDLPGSAMGLSEPVIINDLVGWRRRGADLTQHARVMTGALDLLARPWGESEAVVVKPSNVINPLAMAVMALRPQSSAVLLHAPVRSFLASVARKGLWCRLWARELLEGYLKEGFLDLGFGPEDYFRQSDLQVAAVGWLAQQAQFIRLSERFGPRVASLDSEALTADPATVVARAASFLGLSATKAEDYADHPAFTRDSKSGERFAIGQRQADQQGALAAHADEIDKVAIWAEAVAKAAGIAMTLPQPLLR